MFQPTNGPFYEFYSTGQLKVEGMMKDGNCSYYASYTKYGTLEEEYIYNEEDYDSYIKKIYYPNGSIKSEYTYVNEDLNGRFTEYRINGTKYYDGYYHNGLKYGIWNYYDENGAKIREERYRRGRQHGVERKFKNGRIIEEIIFNYGYSKYEISGKTKAPPFIRIVGWFQSFKDKKYDNC